MSMTTNPNIKLAEFINETLSAETFTRNHAILGTLTPLLGAAIGTLVYFALFVCFPKISWGLTGNLAAAGVAGALITGIALASVIEHYRKNKEKVKETLETEKLFVVLQNVAVDLAEPSSTEGCIDDQGVIGVFEELLKTRTDEQWVALITLLCNEKREIAVYIAQFLRGMDEALFNRKLSAFSQRGIPLPEHWDLIESTHTNE